MSYNALNYPGSTATERNPYFSTVISNANPDILVMQEMTSQAGVNGFLTNVLTPINANYTAGIFLDGPDTDNAIFFKSNLFSFVSNTAIPTTLRDINEFKLVYTATGDTLRIYSVHLKASTGTTNEQQRLAEVTLLRNVTDALPLNKDYIVCGDFNIYGSTEPAYQKLLNQSTTGYFIDLFNLTGSWNNSSYAQYHTQSPRTRSFGGGATGGMDDRFDMILLSPAIFAAGGISYVSNSYTPYGNDGLHYNDSINRPPNNAVGQTIANAIHYASDHIPVFANFAFETSNVQIAINTNPGWNLISIPLLAPDMTPSSIFPFSLGQFYSYNNGYNVVSQFVNGRGYWGRFDTNGSTIVTGSIVNGNSISVNPGWNIVGPLHYNVVSNSITTTPPNILISPFYGSLVGYFIADTLKPGKGYWVKSNSSGFIHLPSNLIKESTTEINHNFISTILISDYYNKTKVLYLTNETDLSKYELPPLPPPGLFDVRFSSGNYAENIAEHSGIINLTDCSYPVKIKLQGVAVHIKDLTNNINQIIKDQEEIIVNDSTLKVLIVNKVLELSSVKDFVLYQNYPNPFNPSTTISYEIPNVISTEGRNLFVTLKIYDVLGNEIATLVNEQQQPGYHKINFDASALSSGMYFYTLQSGNKILTNKMLMIK